MWHLHDSGVRVIPITGRPAGWCDLICRQWPVAGVVGENGAFAYFMDGEHLRSLNHPSTPEPDANRGRLAEIAEQVYHEVPGTRPSKDQFSRLYDIAVDFREEPPLLDLESARRIKSIFESHGAQARISSIHVNAWFGAYNKVSMTRLFLADRFGFDLDDPAQNRTAVFVGDSPNDEPMFETFRNSIGVSNVTEYSRDMTHLPRYVTSGASASGFVEAVGALLTD
jgi:HAD superfamily hydrolase (TIGR01484 family)